MQIYRRAGKTAITLLTLSLVAPLTLAQDDSDRWFSRAWGGYSALGDTGGRTDAFTGERLDVSTGGGFTAGAGIGYRYGERLGLELAWEYRSNDSEVDVAGGEFFDGGNYASNTVFLNAYYFLPRRGAWEPYLGAGIGWLQEVDIDLEGAGPEQSFSGSGDAGLQLFVGSNYHLNDHWAVHGELRYGSFSGIDLDGENVNGTISDFDYEPLTMQLGVSYSF